jgi:hypothetical protein
MNAKSAAELWNKLEELYMTKSLANKLRLKERLYTIRMAEGTSIQSHLNEFNSICVDLESLDVKIDDEDKAILLVVSLPPSFKHFKEIMVYENHTSLTFENVKSNLLSKEKFDVDSRYESKDECFIVRGRTQQAGSSNKPKSRSKSRDRKSNTSCRYCKADNHVISQCPKLKNKKEMQKKKESDKSSAEASIVENSDGGEALMITSNDEKRMSWILDSACSFHICSHREWFSDYSHVHNGNVIIGDESRLEISGISSIQIKVHDGTFKTLTNVRYVPKMERNFISLGTLEAMRFKFSADNGVLKVSQGNRVVLKAKHFNNLYYLQGSTAAAISIASNTSNTKLWHMRLGHMSEKVCISCTREVI